jgi:hypothetical protein
MSLLETLLRKIPVGVLADSKREIERAVVGSNGKCFIAPFGRISDFRRQILLSGMEILNASKPLGGETGRICASCHETAKLQVIALCAHCIGMTYSLPAEISILLDARLFGCIRGYFAFVPDDDDDRVRPPMFGGMVPVHPPHPPHGIMVGHHPAVPPPIVMHVIDPGIPVAMMVPEPMLRGGFPYPIPDPRVHIGYGRHPADHGGSPTTIGGIGVVPSSRSETGRRLEATPWRR